MSIQNATEARDKVAHELALANTYDQISKCKIYDFEHKFPTHHERLAALRKKFPFKPLRKRESRDEFLGFRSGAYDACIICITKYMWLILADSELIAFILQRDYDSASCGVIQYEGSPLWLSSKTFAYAPPSRVFVGAQLAETSYNDLRDLFASTPLPAQ